jgi:hypothetical protein
MINTNKVQKQILVQITQRDQNEKVQMVAMLELILFLHKRVLLMMKMMNLQYYHLILYQMGRSLCIKNIWNKKTTRRREKEKKRKRKEKK